MMNTFIVIKQTCEHKKLKGLSLSFQFFEYLSFEFEYLSFEFEYLSFVFGYFANLLQISKNVIQNKKKTIYFLSMDLSINFKFRKKIKIDKNPSSKKIKIDKNPSSKSKFIYFYFKLSFLKFVRDLQNTQTQTQSSNTQKIENSNPSLKILAI